MNLIKKKTKTSKKNKKKYKKNSLISKINKSFITNSPKTHIKIQKKNKKL